jgi:hypothetical protein
MNHHQGFPRRRADELRGQDEVVRHTHPKYGPKGVHTRLPRGARVATPPCRAVFFTFSFPPPCYLRAGFQIGSLPGPRIHLRRTRGWLLRAWWPRSRCVVSLPRSRCVVSLSLWPFREASAGPNPRGKGPPARAARAGSAARGSHGGLQQLPHGLRECLAPLLRRLAHAGRREQADVQVGVALEHRP